ncbi:MAG: integrase core domain-containing protein [Ureaplasma sp.]|nr:integrase core domain-containing protein [Ureaplasma sp.]
MSRHLKPNEWIYLFELYNNNYEKFIYEFKRITQRRWEVYWVRKEFKDKMKNYLYNYDVEVIMSKTGKSTKKGKSGRPKNSKSKDTIIKEIIRELPDDLLKEIVKDWIDKTNKSGDEKSNEILRKVIKTSSCSLRKLSEVIGLSKSHLWRIKSGWSSNPKEINVQKSYKEKLVIKIFFDLDGTRGKGPIAAIAKKKYGIEISASHAGKLLAKNGLKSTTRIRNSAKAKEDKNIKVNIPDLVKRDYDNILHQETIIASDVTYIESPMDVLNQKHIFLSIAILHSNKSIISFKLSRYNDALLAFDTIHNIWMENVIFHTDHGAIYTSNLFMTELIKKKWLQSMSAVGNSLDNREPEHFFGVFKTEFLSKINVKKLTFDELEQKIIEWINYYNYERIQKKLGWQAPNFI